MGLGNTDLERRIKAVETLTREEVLGVWNDVRTGVRKQFPHDARRKTGFLKNSEHRKILGQEFVSQYLQEHGKYPEGYDYRDARLGGLLNWYYDSSPYQLLRSVGFTDPENVIYYDVVLDKMPWLTIRLPQNFWQSKEGRVKATRWAVRLLKRFGKEVEDIGWKDITALVGPIRSAQKEHTILPDLLEEAGYKLNIMDLQKVPDSYWENPDNRRSYVLRRTKELGRLPGSSEVSSAVLRQAGSYKKLLEEANLLTLK